MHNFNIILLSMPKAFRYKAILFSIEMYRSDDEYLDIMFLTKYHYNDIVSYDSLS
jgi:hypothetical protein